MNDNSRTKTSALDNISVVVSSGDKYLTGNGFKAIKDGIKGNDNAAPVAGRKPSWLRAKVPGGGKYEAVKNNVREHKLATVCEESKCCLLYTSDAADE